MINYDTRSLAVGDGIITQIEFDFLITKKSDLLISLVESGQATLTYRGDDTTFLSNVTFDSVEGGGTVTLLAVLPAGKTLYIDLDVQEPDQPNAFRIVNNYLTSFRAIERAMDYVATQIQTLSRWKEQSVKLPRHIDPANFDPTVPEAMVGDLTNVVMVTNDAGTGWKVGPSVVSLAGWAASAIAAAAAALVSQNAAAASAAAALVSENNSAGSEAAVAASATAAAQSAADADVSATNASSAQGYAQTAAADAQNSATDAQDSADDSEASATAAAAEVVNAAAQVALATTQADNAATSATAAAGSATAAAASATAAAASAAAAAASAGAASTTIVGTYGSPTAVVGANGVLFSSTTYHTINFISGSGGNVDVTHNPGILAGSAVGQRLTLIGGANTVTLHESSGLFMCGQTITLANGSMAVFVWCGTFWLLESQNGG